MTRVPVPGDPLPLTSAEMEDGICTLTEVNRQLELPFELSGHSFSWRTAKIGTRASAICDWTICSESPASRVGNGAPPA